MKKIENAWEDKKSIQKEKRKKGRKKGWWQESKQPLSSSGDAGKLWSL